MTHSRRIRFFLILAALLPPLLILWYLIGSRQSMNQAYARKAADNGLRDYITLESDWKKRLGKAVSSAAASRSVRESVIRLESGKPSGRRFNLSATTGGSLDFAEIADRGGRVVASMSRPGLVGQRIVPFLMPASGSAAPLHSVEFDKEGQHAAYSYTIEIQPGYYLFAGAFLDDEYKTSARHACDCSLQLVFEEDSLFKDDHITRMDAQTLYNLDGEFVSLLSGGKDAGFYLFANFPPPDFPAPFTTLLPVAALIAAAGVIVALALGLYITGRTRREIDNLVSAFSRVAKGDFSTPVMAYEEGEFSELADSFSEMMRRLSESQTRLARSEKIAAWQAMGRKVAHEIKNPLTPIGIAVDDVRRSYEEKLPGFPDTLRQSTQMVKGEIRRLTTLLEQFVQFARMTPPALHDTSLDNLASNIKQIYQFDIEKGRLDIHNRCGIKRVRIDLDQLTQVLVNLIKNGLESAPDSRVTVSFDATNGGWSIEVTDTGAGFKEEILAAPFEPYVSTKKEGSGLGLVICHRIVVDHGGSMELANRTEGGARVVIRFPEE